jgi:glycosyltransferase involved in cell wall biosynthesis
MPKVIHLTSAHGRYDSRIFLKQCRSLAKKQYQVTLIVADDNSDEVKDGVSIISVGRSTGRIDRMLCTTRKIYTRAINLNGDIYHLHDPELLLIAMQLKFLGKRVIFDMHEDTVMQIRIKPYLNAGLRFIISRCYKFFEEVALKRVDGVAAATSGLLELYGANARCSAAVPNYVDVSQFPSREVSFERPVLFHAGALTTARGLDNMVALAGLLPCDGELLLAGGLDPGYSPVDLRPAKYLGILNEKRLMGLYASSNIGLILYNPVGQYGVATAIKAYEYMAASMPIIMPSHGEWPSLNDKVNCGLNVPVGDVRAVADAVEWLMANPGKAKEMGLNGRRFVERYASWDVSVGNLIELYQRVWNSKS